MSVIQALFKGYFIITYHVSLNILFESIFTYYLRARIRNTFNEKIKTYLFVRNNNNIVARNLFVNDYSANKPGSKHSIDIVNGEGVVLWNYSR